MMFEEVLHKLASLDPGQYLFVIGSVYLALLLTLRRRWVLAGALVALAVVWQSFFGDIYEYVESLSADSFVEAQHFDRDEARFWLLTMRQALHADLSWKYLAFYLAVGASSFYVLRLLLLCKARLRQGFYLAAMVTLAFAMIGVSVYKLTAQAVSSFVMNSEDFGHAVRNFDQPVPTLPAARNQLDLVVYIGESTTAMNMGLYGYPRNTTPRLSQMAREDDHLLVFRHVFSTYVYTTQSLLEALSFGLDAREEALPIMKRRRIPLPDVLARAGVETRLASNQGLRGAYEHAGKILFGRVDSTFRMAGDLDALRAGLPPSSRWDDDFFASELAREGDRGDGARITFLHSYAGHGPYLENIPPAFRQPVDGLLAHLAPGQFTSDGRQKVTDSWGVEGYDSAVRYVDHSVAQAIEHVRRRERPAVLLYFSDHGEAPFRGIGHDAARLQHEMLRVPFLLYFNEAARREYAQVFARYQRLARTGEIATLAQLPSTLLDLLGIDPGRRAADSGLRLTPLIGERRVLQPIFIRENQHGISFLNLNADPMHAVAPNGEPLIERDDPDTRMFVAWHSGRLSASEICPGPPRSFEELSRRILIAHCQAGFEALFPLIPTTHSKSESDDDWATGRRTEARPPGALQLAHGTNRSSDGRMLNARR
jgi:hypothetical protein